MQSLNDYAPNETLLGDDISQSYGTCHRQLPSHSSLPKAFQYFIVIVISVLLLSGSLYLLFFDPEEGVGAKAFEIIFALLIAALICQKICRERVVVRINTEKCRDAGNEAYG